LLLRRLFSERAWFLGHTRGSESAQNIRISEPASPPTISISHSVADHRS
jgi:hypothetical protein